MSNLTTTTQVDSGTGLYYDRVLLMRAQPYLIHEVAAQVRNIPAGTGTTVKFRRYASLTVATTPLSEGITPAGKQLSKTDLTAKVSQYGDYIHITDWVDLTVEDPVLTEANELLGEQMGKTRDVLVRDILMACASSTDASGGSNGNTPTELTKDDVDAVVKTLLNADADMITNVKAATTGVGTTPIRSAFIGLMNTNLIDDLEAVSNFVPTSKYPGQDVVMNAEWGATGNVRWLVSSQAHRDTAATPDEYSLAILGQHAYGVTAIEGGAAKSIVKAFGSGGTTDPLDQRATAGWKMPFVCRILNDSFMHVLNVTHS